MLAAIYDTLPHQQFLTALPAPLRSPTAMAILICRVLVPRQNAARARAWTHPPTVEYNMPILAERCCPDLLVHVGY